ncbi:efflux transporter outer membrane subunit [Xanthomonas prunicola]|uniref:Efflux transporter outer membrane subunit n=1 Tax=Xanthomonas prunicola TaxID=2053930 RepID=A0A9Q9J451_9XANT|nr:efflux transporter outer membrane subunit [Xanthomonas prunicola]USJ01080.1 efflux transporter outer membrane subunit [Xanthomonas prunicola]UXA49603.1 efflux transporter outer membrane subunit [Xanthomonas prunicola]UXA52703.1 efflux transporter outer membrane subunit [Xanthomonas prunicola]UXA57899.1 efflux transporter outer membrane subunit [Xanthomonas prunicola]UXA60051.1 efflux transporter outer membrane subunit [Xanthomonas prunicola]
MVRNALGLTLAALVLSGCAVGPDYRPEPPAAVTLQGAQDPAYSTQSPVGNWWSQFDDPVLEQLVRDALFANHDLRIAVARVKQARAVFVERRLDQAPHITAQSSFDRREQQQVVAGNQRFLTEQTTLGLDAAWELDLFGRQRRASEAARADLDAEQANLQDVQVTVAAEVARNYFELRGTQKQLEVSKRTLTNLHDTQRLTQTRWDLGAGSELDVQSSLARLKAIEADIPLLETAEAQYRHRLAVLLGQQPDALDATLVARTTPAFARALPLGDTAGLLRQRPDVRSAERRLAAATAQVGVATADLFPRISVSGFVGFLSGDAARLTQGNAKAWSVTPSISWAAFDFGTVRARLRASKAQAEGALAQYQQAVLLALEDTENALIGYGRQQARLAIVVEQANAARRAEQLAQIRYREGSEDFLTLLDAQRTQLAADDALAQAEAAVNVGVVGVYKALGGWKQDQAPAAPVAVVNR